MKKILIVIFAVFAMAMTSCTERLYGDYGVVSKVEYYGGSPAVKFNKKYLVTVNHNTLNKGRYEFTTDRLYVVGDTIEIVGKKYKY